MPQALPESVHARGDERLVEAELAMSGGHPGLHLGRRELQDPAKVLSRHVVPGGSKDVCAHDLTGIDGLPHRGLGSGRAQRDRVAGQGSVLGLHAEQLTNHGRRVGRRSRQALGCQPLREDDIEQARIVAGGHDRVVS